MTEKTNKKIVLALVWNLRLGICDSCLPLAWYLKFACPPSFWRGACDLLFICDFVLGICDFIQGPA
jgi:hypothetical protein